MRALAPLALVLLVSCRSGGDPVPEARADDRPAAQGGVAVLELFTSEGCSSCPPADAVLADLSRAHGASVFALGFHVDYWNELGWPDRFSSREATARQYAYSKALGAGGVFTPELVVGGVDALNGTDRAGAEAAIARQLAQPASVRLALRARAASGDALVVDYEAEGAPGDAVIEVAVVERAATTEVKAGENSGKTLRHVSIVRAFAGAPAAPRGTVTIPLPAAIARGDLEVLGFVQRPGGRGMPVLGAARAQTPG